MKPNEIKPRIASRDRRESGDAPALGRVSRMRDFPSSRAERHRGRRGGRSHPPHKKSILIWSAVIGWVALAAIGLTISLWILPRMNESSGDEGGKQAASVVRDRVFSKFASPSREQAMEIVRLAISNRDPQRIESLFRKGAATETEILNFLKNLEAKNGPVERYDWLSSMDVDGMLIEGVLAVFKSAEKPVERIAFLTPDTNGTWKMDFDSFARTVKPSWDELIEKGADHATVRVVVGKDFYFNGPFSDESQWTCYGIASPDTDVLLQGYCRVGSQQAEEMGRMFLEGETMRRATLELQRVKDADSRQFEITQVHSRDWILANSADDPSR